MPQVQKLLTLGANPNIRDTVCYYHNIIITVFLLKIRHGNNNIALASPNF